MNSTTGQGTLTLNTNNTNIGDWSRDSRRPVREQQSRSGHPVRRHRDLQRHHGPSGAPDRTPWRVCVHHGRIGSHQQSGEHGRSLLDQRRYDARERSRRHERLRNGHNRYSSFSGTVGEFDSLGRGSITSTLNYGGSPITLNYYVIGPEAVRLNRCGYHRLCHRLCLRSGTNSTSGSNSAIGTSVFALNGSPSSCELLGSRSRPATQHQH